MMSFNGRTSKQHQNSRKQYHSGNSAKQYHIIVAKNNATNDVIIVEINGTKIKMMSQISKNYTTTPADTGLKS